MLKNISRLELTIANKFYRFDCDADSDLSHCKEALFQFQKFIGMIEDNIKANQAAEAAKEKPDIEPISQEA